MRACHGPCWTWASVRELRGADCSSANWRSWRRSCLCPACCSGLCSQSRRGCCSAARAARPPGPPMPSTHSAPSPARSPPASCCCRPWEFRAWCCSLRYLRRWRASRRCCCRVRPGGGPCRWRPQPCCALRWRSRDSQRHAGIRCSCRWGPTGRSMPRTSSTRSAARARPGIRRARSWRPSGCSSIKMGSMRRCSWQRISTGNDCGCAWGARWTRAPATCSRRFCSD